MAILNKYKRWKSILLPMHDKYWDFVISPDNAPSALLDTDVLNRECLSAYIDISNPECLGENMLSSLPWFTWHDAMCENVVLKDIGLTGIDNGFIPFDKQYLTNTQVYNILTGSEWKISDNDKSLHLYRIEGGASVYTYPMTLENGYYALKGGFFQGAYKFHGFNYQVLPQHIEQEWNLEFVLRPRDYEEGKTTMNTAFPENKGIFFYMGTRSENKFSRFYNTDFTKYSKRDMTRFTDPCDKYMNSNYFADVETCIQDESEKRKAHTKATLDLLWSFLYAPYHDVIDCECGKEDEEKPHQPLPSPLCNTYLVDDDYFTPQENISDKPVVTSEGDDILNIGVDTWEVETDNKFLTFDRTKNGFTVDTFDEDAVVKFYGKKHSVATNLYLIMHRGKGGYTVDTLDEYYKTVDGAVKYDEIGDIKNNAFALRIDDEGRIGYKYLIKDCDVESGYSVKEEYSYPVIKKDMWQVINVKISILNGYVDACSNPSSKRKMKIFVYVDGYLKFVSQELPEFDFRELNEDKLKQEGVPFNISLGGGTQGLSETIWLNYTEVFPYILPLEQNFAGTFIGDIKSFGFFTCPMEYKQIKNNALRKKEQLKTIY